MMKTFIVALVASMALLAISESVEAARMRCGSSWEMCAQRGKGPGAAQGVVQPGGKQIKQQQR
jgi:hypothetical protein